jgi:hypothetical protein
MACGLSFQLARCAVVGEEEDFSAEHFLQLQGAQLGSAQVEADGERERHVFLDSYWKRMEGQTVQPPYIPEVTDFFDGSLYEDFDDQEDFQDEEAITEFTGDSAIFSSF